MYKLLVSILLLFGVVAACKSDNEFTCGELVVSWNESLQKIDEVSLNLGEIWSCYFKSEDKPNKELKVSYKVIPLNVEDKKIEELITDFYAKDQNKLGNEIYVLNAGSFNLKCFEDFDEEVAVVLEKCVAYSNDMRITIVSRLND